MTTLDRIDEGVALAAATPPADVRFLLRLAVALHRFGVPAHRLEEAMGLAARRLGRTVQFLAMPTALHATFGDRGAGGDRTYLQRVEPAATDLGRLASVDHLLGRFLDGSLGRSRAEGELDTILAQGPRYGARLVTACFAVTSAAASRFFGGGLVEILVAGVIGLLIGAASEWRRARGRSAAPLFEAAAGCAAACLAGFAAWLGLAFTPQIAIVAGLIVLVPGLQLTTAIIEVATGHSSSGSARLIAAIVALASIGFGVALGSRLCVVAFGMYAATAPVPLPLWTEGVALLVAPFAFGVILSAALRDLGWVCAASCLAFLGARAGAVGLGAQLGALVGAFVVGIASNAFARRFDRPASLVLVPGLLLLVPGALGFRSLTSLFARDVLDGVQTGATMLLVVMALVTGLLLAQAVVPPRRAL